MATQNDLDMARDLLDEGKPVYDFAVKVLEPAVCNFCHKPTDALVDGKTLMGPWANMCDAHFLKYGVGLGLGKGQVILRS